LDGETLYYVHSFKGILSPEDRAAAVNHRIAILADDPFFTPSLFSTQEVDGTTRILYRDEAVGLVTSEDVAAEGEPADEIVAQRIQAITKAIVQHRHRQLPQARVRATIIIAGATLLLIFLLMGLRRAHRTLQRRIQDAPTPKGAATLQTWMGMGPKQLIALELRAAGVARFLVTLVVLLIYLQVVFSFVPMTRGFALTVLEYVIEPLRRLWLGLLREVGNIITIVVLVTLTRYALKGLRWALYEAAANRVTIPGIANEWGIPLYKILRIVVIALSAVMIYPYVPGSDTEAFKGLSLFAGALFTLGATGTVGNFIGGLVAIFVGAFRIGDMVKLGDTLGVVTETTMTLTRIRTPLNEMVSVPNIAILNGQLINYSTMARTDGVILTTSVTIGYDAPWRTVHGLLVAAASRTAGVEKTPAPFVLQTSLDDFYVSYQLNVHTKDPVHMRNIYGELHENIQDAFNAAGVEIMSAHYASVRDGNTVTIPEAHRPKGYAAPRFGLRIERTDDATP